MRWTIDHEIGRRFARPCQLRPDAGIIWLQRIVRQSRPVATNTVVERLRPLRIDVVVLLFDPLDVRSKSHAAGKIERHVSAETAIDTWGRVDQPRKHWTSGVAIVIATRQHESRHALLRIILCE